jgi:hypothetical protein
MKRILDYDPLTGITEIFHHDDLTNESVIETVQDVEPALEHNKRLQIEVDSHKQIKEGWLHYAHIPNSLILKWKIEKGIDLYNPNDKGAIFKLLNDPEYAYLKTTDAHHSVKS